MVVLRNPALWVFFNRQGSNTIRACVIMAHIVSFLQEVLC
jgi:hypothetical protein